MDYVILFLKHLGGLMDYVILFLAHLCFWWVFVFFIVIVLGRLSLIVKPKDCFRVSLVSYVLHLCLLYLTTKGGFFG